uniref:Uncharacterized protein n=1 Tax=viral metagenome TaxID=1070528 RepID=A0A6C0CKP5_9ZZZZ
MDAAPVVPQHPPPAKKNRRPPSTLELNKDSILRPDRPDIVIPDVSQIIDQFQKEMDELKQKSVTLLRTTVEQFEQVRILVLSQERETRINVEKAKAFKRKVQALLQEEDPQSPRNLP